MSAAAFLYSIQVEYSRIDGHGLNMEELRANPRLSYRLVQDLNKNATLPFADER